MRISDWSSDVCSSDLADSDTDVEQPLFGEPGSEPEVQAWRHNRVVALLPDGIDPEQVLEQAQAQSGLDYLASSWSTRDVPDADWVQLTQSQFGPIHIGERLWIVTSWHRDDPEDRKSKRLNARH